MRIRLHERIVRKAGIFCCVWNYKQISLSDGVRANGNIARYFVDGQTDFGLEPLTIGVDETNYSNWGITDAGCQFNNLVVVRFRRCIENATSTQRVQTVLFMLQYGGA